MVCVDACGWTDAASQSCMVHGGDGFAFVVHLDGNASSTIGQPGEGLGYAGIRNALVFEFDTWYNPDQGDHFTDHVRWGWGPCGRGGVAASRPCVFRRACVFPLHEQLWVLEHWCLACALFPPACNSLGPTAW